MVTPAAFAALIARSKIASGSAEPSDIFSTVRLFSILHSTADKIVDISALSPSKTFRL